MWREEDRESSGTGQREQIRERTEEEWCQRGDVQLLVAVKGLQELSAGGRRVPDEQLARGAKHASSAACPKLTRQPITKWVEDVGSTLTLDLRAL